jgi:hypothetical protein
MDEYTELFNKQIGRVEELAGRLLFHRFESAQDLWAIQIDLARLQIELREEVSKERVIQRDTNAKISDTAKRQEADWKTTIQGHQAEVKRSEVRVSIHEHALDLSKQIGDTIAWLFLRGDENRIRTLAGNQPNPPIPKGVSLQAMLAVAEGYANAGAGFPLIHDITNCLRVGDLTFVDFPGDEFDEPLTVEVKTKTLSVEGDVANLRVSVYAAAHSPKFVAVTDRLRKVSVESQEPTGDGEQSKEGEEGKSPPKRRKPDLRLGRQIKRMSRVKSLLSARPNEPIKELGQDTLRVPYLPIEVMMRPHQFHWDVVRELAERAKAEGCAVRAVDDAFFYVATYTDTATLYPWSRNIELPFADKWAELAKAAFPRCADTEQNHICFMSTWDYLFGRAPRHVRPFLLYELSPEMRIDILRRRLTIIVFINIGKLVEALHGVKGLSARVPKDGSELMKLFIPATYEQPLPDGSKILIRGVNLNEFAAKVAFEFLSLEGFVECVSHALKTVADAAKIERENTRAAGM